MKTILELLRRLFDLHDWKYEGVQRTCTTCGRKEVDVLDDQTGHWETLSAGDRRLHS